MLHFLEKEPRACYYEHRPKFNLQCHECLTLGSQHTEEEKRLICVFTKVLKNVSQLDVTAEQCPQ